MDFSQSYRFAPGFAFRRESFGGVICHFEGRRPDPRLVFVDSPFLIGVLELLDQGPLDDLVAQVCAHFGLQAGQEAALRRFLSNLGKRGALVAQ